MSKVKIKLNRAGVRELLLSGEMLSECQGAAEGVAMRAGSGYSVTPYATGKTRVNVSVSAETDEAKADNSKNNTLLKAIGR